MRLRILYVSHMPPSPPRCGAQARVHGLMTELARHHDLSAVMLVDDEFDIEESRKSMQAYCRDVTLLPNPVGQNQLVKRMAQLRSLTSTQSFERFRASVPDLQKTLDRTLQAQRFDIVNLEFPYLAHLKLRQAPAGERLPRLIVDSHEIAYDLARQFAESGSSLARRAYAHVNWRKLRREELAAYGDADGVCLCSTTDELRLHQELPAARTAVIPNAADTNYFKPQPGDPPIEGKSVVYFGLLSTIPNIDGVTHFVNDIWPRIAREHPDARLKIVGGRAPPSVTALASETVELTGFVDDLRPHLASASVIVVPLRLGGGTRLKILESMAMGKAIVSTALGAEGIEAENGRDILIEDNAERFSAAVSQLLSAPDLAARIGASGRRLVEERYSWRGAARELENFYRRTIEVNS